MKTPTFADLAAEAKKNAYASAPSYPLLDKTNHEEEGITFTRPTKYVGYFGVLQLLTEGMMPRKCIISNMSWRPNTHVTIFRRLADAQLVDHNRHGYWLTKLGRNYVAAALSEGVAR